MIITMVKEEQKKLREGIDSIIQKTFNALDTIYRIRRGISSPTGTMVESDDRLIFPSYSDGEETRVSEQELRFIFVDQFIKYCSDTEKNFDYYYSVETPTEYRYAFFRDNITVPRVYLPEETKGKSASIDMSIYAKDKKTKVASIEFKKDGCSAHEIAKDFLKLSVEPNDGMLRYFIMISSSETILSDTAKSGKEKGLLAALRKKFNCDCFKLKLQNNSSELIWHDIIVYWHRLPCSNDKNIDRNDFDSIYHVDKKTEEWLNIKL